MVRVKRGWVTDTSIDVSAFELEHGESETELPSTVDEKSKRFELEHGESETPPLQTAPVIHISRRTRRKRPDRAM